MSPVPSVAALLQSARSRLRLQRAVGDLGTGLLAAGGLLLLAVALHRWAGLAVWHRWVWAAAPALALLFPLLRALLAPLQTVAIARHLDAVGHTHDRLATALALESETATPMAALAREECARWLTGRDFRPLLPWRLSPAWRYLAVPLVAIALVQWDLARHSDSAEPVAENPAPPEDTPTVTALRALARELQEKADRSGDEALRRLAAEMARRAELLRHNSGDPAAAEKNALRELSGLEQLAQELQRARAEAPTAEDLKALAGALEKAEASRAAAEKMRTGDLAQAARELERLARKAAGAKPEAAAAQAEAALRQALEQLTQQQGLSQGTRKQLSAGGDAQTQSKLQQLADLLRKLPPQQQGAKAGQPGGNQQAASPEDLDRLLAALQNMKYGQGGEPGKPADGAPPDIVQISPAGKGEPSGQLSIPSANPGGEKDKGTTETPFGSTQDKARKGADLALSGQQSEQGETALQYLPGGPDVSRSSRRYRELYNALAPAAENAVLQEEIPLGSRLFIKRYFESIRPGL